MDKVRVLEVVDMKEYTEEEADMVEEAVVDAVNTGAETVL